MNVGTNGNINSTVMNAKPGSAGFKKKIDTLGRQVDQVQRQIDDLNKEEVELKKRNDQLWKQMKSTAKKDKVVRTFRRNEHRIGMAAGIGMLMGMTLGAPILGIVGGVLTLGTIIGGKVADKKLVTYNKQFSQDAKEYEVTKQLLEATEGTITALEEGVYPVKQEHERLSKKEKDARELAKQLLEVVKPGKSSPAAIVDKGDVIEIGGVKIHKRV